MSIQIQPYTEELSESVAEFNKRVAPAKASFSVPVTPVPGWLPKRPDRSIHQEIFLALEERRVRGAYTLKLQEFLCGGVVRTVGSCQMPISEGIVDQRYALVGLQIMQDALRRQPLAYDLGIGSFDASIAKVHRAMGWQFRAIPFFFRIENGFRFAREIAHLRSGRVRQIALDLAALSGVAWTSAKVMHACSKAFCTARDVVQGQGRADGDLVVESFTEFGCWADDIWRQARGHYSMAAVRSAEVLDILYPPENERFIRIRVLRGDHTIGWAVLLSTRMEASKHFGNMYVGSIVDCLAIPAEENAVIAEATRILERRGVDLMVTNQSHRAWRDACLREGFLSGPSNYILGASKEFSRLLNEWDPNGERIHITRGDGDGPIHL